MPGDNRLVFSIIFSTEVTHKTKAHQVLDTWNIIWLNINICRTGA